MTCPCMKKVKKVKRKAKKVVCNKRRIIYADPKSSKCKAITKMFEQITRRQKMRTKKTAEDKRIVKLLVKAVEQKYPLRCGKSPRKIGKYTYVVGCFGTAHKCARTLTYVWHPKGKYFTRGKKKLSLNPRRSGKFPSRSH